MSANYGKADITEDFGVSSAALLSQEILSSSFHAAMSGIRQGLDHHAETRDRPGTTRSPSE
jgi:hypothetical protein